MRRTVWFSAGASVALVAASLGMSQTAGARVETCEARVNNSQQKLQECVTLAGVREHQAALQAIADANGGTRAAGTPGYDASLDYVVQRLTSAGYAATVDEFPFLYVPPAQLRRTAPVPGTYETGTFTGSGQGEVTAPVTYVDIQLALPRANSSGCEAADFAGFPAGNIALIQRGSCSFAIKAVNAEAAGASAVIIFNQGDTPAREDLIVGTLAPTTVTIPVVGSSFADGAALTEPGAIAWVKVDPPRIVSQYNVIAESRGGDSGNVVVAGAHLDSVQRGPGINDNGSGTAALIEVAEQMANVAPRLKVRFAFWGAEESGLIGSQNYVAGLSSDELAKIDLYLNFDMIGSPNHVFFIYDGDDSDAVGASAGPTGSAQIERTFESFYNTRGLPFKGTDFSGRSDYGPFIAAGIPAGGLFTGAEGIKSAAEASLWGGTAGQAYDPCYHLACDTYANNNDRALEVNSDAVAFSILKYAMSTKGNFSSPATGGGGIPSDSLQGGLPDHSDEPATA